MRHCSQFVIRGVYRRRMRADRRNPVIKELRRFKPAKFLITLRDGTRKEAPLSTKANKWEIFDELIERLPWAVIEAQSTDGATLGVVESDEEPDEDFETDGADVYERMAKISGDLCIRIMTTTQQETRKMFTDAMRGNAEALTNLVESQRAMQDGYQVALKVASMTKIGDGQAPDGSDPVMEMMKMAMMINAGKPPAPPKPMPKPANPPNGKPVAQ